MLNFNQFLRFRVVSLENHPWLNHGGGFLEFGNFTGGFAMTDR